MTTFSKKQINFYTISPKDEGQRIDNLLLKILKGVPKSHIYRIIRNGEVRINKKRVTALSKVMLNDIIRIPPIEIMESIQPQKTHIPKVEFPIIFEDEYFLIINKPEGIACHGGSGVSFGVIEILRNNKPEYKFLELVHRLDRDTSGLLILAKKRNALVELQNLIRNNLVAKYYLALTVGSWSESSRNLKAPLHKYLTQSGERRVSVNHESGQYAQTIFTKLTSNENYTLVKADLKTGRTHQIRVHLQYIGHPIVGDTKYGDENINKSLAKIGLKRMFLHAYEIKFTHPITQQNMCLKATLPESLTKFFTVLQLNINKNIDGCEMNNRKIVDDH